MAELTIREGKAATRAAGAAAKQVLPRLPYGHAALEPHIDARTMLLHHGTHHASYVDKLNAALAGYPDLQQKTALWLLLNPLRLPKGIRAVVRDNAGGHVNHSLFWQAMSPEGGGAPAGPLADAIERDFGSFELFKAQFEEAGIAQFGSGWVWLVRTRSKDGRLKVLTTSGHGNPLEDGRAPLLLNDVWEHAYYLKHASGRADYLRGWWPVVNWAEAERRYESPDDESRIDRKISRYPWTRKIL